MLLKIWKKNIQIHQFSQWPKIDCDVFPSVPLHNFQTHLNSRSSLSKKNSLTQFVPIALHFPFNQKWAGSVANLQQHKKN